MLLGTKIFGSVVHLIIGARLAANYALCTAAVRATKNKSAGLLVVPKDIDSTEQTPIADFHANINTINENANSYRRTVSGACVMNVDSPNEEFFISNLRTTSFLRLRNVHRHRRLADKVDTG